ncbi:zinc-dependent metalloprotease [bacterium]|nr:zinc-dependent metalloprotease [bacterium]
MAKTLTSLFFALSLQAVWAQTNTTTTEVKPKPYDQVITSAAKSSPGLFTVHRIGDKLYYEIPKNQLDKDLLLVVTVAKGKLGTGDGGGESVDERVVRWHRRDNKVLLLDVDYSMWADPKLPIAKAVAAANNPTILQSFNVETVGANEAPVVEVSKLYVNEIIEFSPKKMLGAKAFDKDRSFLENALAFPENIEVDSTLTLTNADSPYPWANRRGEMGRGSASVRMRYSMVKLPDKPMMPRLRDSRVGYFNTWQTDYGRPEHFVRDRVFLARWRLEKKDPGAALSDPVKPIVFFVDPATPSAWVPYVKRGVEQWQPAFEEAGFKNAIVARDVPANDPNWSMEDARHSVIRWVASETPNAYGPHTSDPRTGEILQADIHMFHNILDLQRRWYFTQVAHLDGRAQRLPMPDDLMGELLEFVVAHEVGHSLGMQHNMRASSTYSVEQVRDREWVKKMGHCPSIMDYSRFNYVAQPEDKIDVKDLIPKVGVYDRFAVTWGYKPIPTATTPDAERETLDQWARQQDQVAWLRFSNMDSRGTDPGDQTEAVGDADPVRATALGVKNLRRINGLLVNATGQYGESYEELKHFRRQLMNQWATEMRHVTPLVGGVSKRDKHFGQSGPVFTVIPKKRQVEAVDFLLREAFVPQDWMVSADIVRLIDLEGSLEDVAYMQERLLYRLVDPWKLNRMAEQMATDHTQAYSPGDLLTTLRRGFFRELTRSERVPLARRHLQRSMTDLLIDLSYTSGEARNHGQRQLRLLVEELKAAQKRYQDEDTLAHLGQLLDDIQRELDPRATGRKDAPLGSRWNYQATGCWFDGGEEWVRPR